VYYTYGLDKEANMIKCGVPFMVIRGLCIVSVAVLLGVAGTITWAAPEVLSMVDPTTSAIIHGAGELAEKLPKDLLRLSLQVALACIGAIVFMAGLLYKMALKMGEKAWLLAREDSMALHRSYADKAYIEGIKDAKNRLREKALDNTP
jgi:hypothetical protein